MIILGVNAFHGDAAAALVRDGKLVAAAEEERFRRIKHWAGFPQAAITYCLAEAGISLGDVDHIVLNQDNRAALWRKFVHLIAAIVSKNAPRLEGAGCSIHWTAAESDLCRRVASAIVDGKVVGWFQGRMEWGPRALGNRSILCDPRRGDMKEVLNAKIKRRESFRPFAPSILETHIADGLKKMVPCPS